MILNSMDRTVTPAASPFDTNTFDASNVDTLIASAERLAHMAMFCFLIAIAVCLMTMMLHIASSMVRSSR